MLFGENSPQTMHNPRTWFSIASLWAFVWFSYASLPAQTRPLHEDTVAQMKTTLQESGVPPTIQGVTEYLNDLHPTPKTKQRLETLIADLGNDDFYRRESAMAELLRLPVRSPDLFNQAIESGDAEVRWRARQVLKQSDSKTQQILHAVLLVIRHEKMAGLTSPILDAIPYCTQTYVREEAIRTLKTITQAEELPIIRTALKRPDPQTQQVALILLEHLAGGEADGDLRQFLKNPNENVQLTAARALGNHGQRDALPVLVDLLDADDLQTRAKTAETLRLLTGENFSFVAYDTAARRTAARTKWVNWVANNGATAKLNFPLPDGPVLRDHTLICNYSMKKVIELDSNHKEVWSTELTGAWGCQGLPNGHRLVTSYTQRCIIEYDMKGKEVWRKQNIPGLPYSVQRLDNGNTMVTCSNNQVVEYAPDGSIAWQKHFNGTPRDAQRLENGNTLVVLYTSQEIIEVDQKGNTVWKVNNMMRPMSAQRLPNGNTLVCQSAGRRLVEVDRNGDEVWSLNTPLSVYDAQRLPNGNTLVVGSTGAIEFDPKGNTVWDYKQPGMRGIHRF